MGNSIEEQAESGVLKAIQSQTFLEKIAGALTGLFKKDQESAKQLAESQAEQIKQLRADFDSFKSSKEKELEKAKADAKAEADKAAEAKAEADKKVDDKEKEVTQRANTQARQTLSNAGHTAVAQEKEGGSSAKSKDELWVEYGKLTTGKEKRTFYLKHQEAMNS